MGKAERVIENYLIARTTEKGWMCRKYRTPGQNGTPDQIVFRPKMTFWAETKTLVGKLSKLQNLKIERMRGYGAIVYILDSKDKVDYVVDSPVMPKPCPHCENLYTKLQTKFVKTNHAEHMQMYYICMNCYKE